MSRLEKLIASLTCFVETGFSSSISDTKTYTNDFGKLITGHNFAFALPWFAIWQLTKHKGLKCHRHSSQEEEAWATVLVCHQVASFWLWKIGFISDISCYISYLSKMTEYIYLNNVATATWSQSGLLVVTMWLLTHFNVAMLAVKTMSSQTQT